MLTFKLSRRGKTKQPTYRLVVVDKKKDPWGMVKEDVGSYNPHNKKAQFKVERIKFWISKGAQPSATVHNLLVKEKIIEAPKKKIKMKKIANTEALKSSETQKGSEIRSSQEKTATTEAQNKIETQKIATTETQNSSESQKSSEIQRLQEKTATAEAQKTANTETQKTATAETQNENEAQKKNSEIQNSSVVQSLQEKAPKTDTSAPAS